MLNEFRRQARSTFLKSLCHRYAYTRNLASRRQHPVHGHSSDGMQLTIAFKGEYCPCTRNGIIGVSNTDSHWRNKHGLGSHDWQGKQWQWPEPATCAWCLLIFWVGLPPNLVPSMHLRKPSPWYHPHTYHSALIPIITAFIVRCWFTDTAIIERPKFPGFRIVG